MFSVPSCFTISLLDLKQFTWKSFHLVDRLGKSRSWWAHRACLLRYLCIVRKQQVPHTTRGPSHYLQGSTLSLTWEKAGDTRMILRRDSPTSGQFFSWEQGFLPFSTPLFPLPFLFLFLPSFLLFCLVWGQSPVTCPRLVSNTSPPASTCTS